MRKLVIGLVAVVILAVASPPVRHWEPGPTPDQIALASEQARSADLEHRLHDAEDRLRRPRPIAFDGEQAARADDLKARLDAAHDDGRADDLKRQLGLAVSARDARGDDLRSQLDRATDRLRTPRPPVTDGTQRARADDLATQNDALTALVERPRPTVVPPVVATMTKDQIVHATHLFGLYTEQAPFLMAEVDLVQTAVDRKADVIGFFQSWDDPFRPDAITDTWARGQIPLMTWESQHQVGAVSSDVPDLNLPSIIDGQHDDCIRSYARGIHDLGLPVIIRLDHEQNGSWYPWSEVEGWSGRLLNGNHRGDYARMWRHVHDIFQQEGANDLTVWLWSPNRVNRIPNQPDPAEFYPGDDVVDWVGMSGYFRPGDEGPTFDDTYGQTLPLLRATTTKPIFLSEIGATEQGGHKTEWITDLFRGLTANPDVIGFGWFNHAVTSGSPSQTNDWRITSSGSSAEAMRNGLIGYS